MRTASDYFGTRVRYLIFAIIAAIALDLLVERTNLLNQLAETIEPRPLVAHCLPSQSHDGAAPDSYSQEQLKEEAKAVVTGTLRLDSSTERLINQTPSPTGAVRSRASIPFPATQLTIDRVYRGVGLIPGEQILLCDADPLPELVVGESVRVLAFLQGKDEQGIAYYNTYPIQGNRILWVPVSPSAYTVIEEQANGGFDMEALVKESGPHVGIVNDSELEKLFSH